MGFVKDTKARMLAEAAQRAIAEGRMVMLVRIDNPKTAADFSGPVSGVAEMIEAVEAQGWWVQHMSYMQPDNKHPGAGFYMFRRR